MINITKKRNWLYCSASVALALIAPLGAAWAQDDAADPSFLNEIVVTGARGSKSVSQIPNSISVISEQDLTEQLRIANNIDKVLERLVPGMGAGGEGTFSSGSTGNGPQLRGRPATVLINGIQINTLLRSNGIDTQLIDPNAIGRVEVKRGASAAFGFGAPGGVIQFLTRQGTSSDLQITAKAQFDFSEEDVQDSARLGVYLGVGQALDDGIDYHVGLGYRSFGQAFDPKGRNVSFETFKSYNLDANIGMQLTDESELRVTVNYFRRSEDQRYLTAGSLAYATDDSYENYIAPEGILSDRLYEDPTTIKSRQTAYVATAKYTNEDVLGSLLEISGFIQQNTFRFPFLDSNFDTLENLEFGDLDQTLDNSRVGFRANMVSKFDLGGTENLTLTYGVDWVQDRMTRTFISGLGSEDRINVNIPGYGLTSYGLPTIIQLPTSPPVELEGLAGYVQADLKFGNLLVTGGIRYEDSSPRSLGYNDGGFVIEAGGLPGFNKWLFNLGAVYDITPRFQVYGGMTQGVEITELGRAVRSAAQAAFEDDGIATIQELQVVNLEPAVTTEYEIGVRGSMGRLDMTLAAFYSRAPSSARVAPPPGSPPNSIFVPVREPTRIWGLEATANYRFSPKLSAGLLFAYQDGKVKFEGEDTFVQLTYDRISPTRLNAYIDWQPSDRFSLGLQGNYTFSSSAFGETELLPFGGDADGDTDSFFVLNLTGAYKAGPGVIGFGISNLLNEEYFRASNQAFRDSLFQIREPGRRFQISYEINF